MLPALFDRLGRQSPSRWRWLNHRMTWATGELEVASVTDGTSRHVDGATIIESGSIDPQCHLRLGGPTNLSVFQSGKYLISIALSGNIVVPAQTSLRKLKVVRVD
jgi:hypothetical protein